MVNFLSLLAFYIVHLSKSWTCSFVYFVRVDGLAWWLCTSILLMNPIEKNWSHGRIITSSSLCFLCCLHLLPTFWVSSSSKSNRPCWRCASLSHTHTDKHNLLVSIVLGWELFFVRLQHMLHIISNTKLSVHNCWSTNLK